ncbi:MAG TPA: EAL domain-containing protein [Casimicrobiaceae bacterium]|nr:EAL domain-containing protein [Casimicrobiaceae bacterium]
MLRRSLDVGAGWRGQMLGAVQHGEESRELPPRGSDALRHSTSSEPDHLGAPIDRAALHVRGRRRRTLQSHILALFLVLMVAVQVGGFVLINTMGLSAARRSIGEDLLGGTLVFYRVLYEETQRLEQGALLMSSDYTFREVIASGDRDTIASVLSKYGRKLDASLMMIVGPGNRVLGDTLDRANAARFAFPELIAEAALADKASAMVLIRGQVYHLVVVPVLAPQPIAWVAIGFAVNDALVEELHTLTRLEVSFFTRQLGNGWRLQDSTLSPKRRAKLVADVARDRFAARDSEGNADSDDAVTRVIDLPSRAGESVMAVLQEPLSSALEPYRRLQHRLTFVALAGVLVSILASVAIARGIAHPVRELARVARRIAGGDYSTVPPPSDVEEIGELATAFRAMQEGIASRESKIMDLAYRDPLTQLPNRTLYNERLDQAIAAAERRGETVAVLLMDLDHFKYVNDTLGHGVGDRILCAVTARLDQVLKRRTDTLARLGGDEFAMVLPGDDTQAAQGVARVILKALEMPVIPEGHRLEVRASIGIAVYPEHGAERSALLRHADVAMYAAKRDKLGCAVWNNDYDAYSRERLVVTNDLRRAIDRDELALVYQPKVVLDGARDHHAEALLRWRHPFRGVVSPSEFIPFAEQSGYMRAVTQWVMAHVIAQCGRWRREGLAMNLSLNISAHDLMDSGLPDHFAALFERHGCAARWITLEIIESAILADPDQGIRSLERLSGLGCRLAIDDYGTGYSSLAYLRRLPVHELKLDKSLVQGMLGDRNDALIVRSTIELAHNLGLSVAAEGVEDQATLEALHELGCDVAQGFVLGRPLEATELAAWMRASTWTRARRQVQGARRAG